MVWVEAMTVETEQMYEAKSGLISTMFFSYLTQKAANCREFILNAKSIALVSLTVPI